MEHEHTLFICNRYVKHRDNLFYIVTMEKAHQLTYQLYRITPNVWGELYFKETPQ
jgi:hypothetical protein